MPHPRTIKLAADGALELIIYGEIGQDFFGDGVSAGRVVDILTAHRDAPAITVRLNSPGGSAFDGVAIYNVLKQHPASVTVHVDGVAASSASIIAMAGDSIRMASGALMMIHNASAHGAGGGAEDLRKTADLVEKLTVQMSEIYAARGNQKAARYLELMDEETWLSASEAIALGLADEEDASAPAMAAHFDPKAYGYRNTPDSITTSAPANQPPATAAGNRIPEPPRRKETDMDIKILAQALGIKSESTEAEIVAAASELHKLKAQADSDRAIVVAVEKFTGKAGEEAVGLVAAWQTADKRATDAEAKLEAQAKAQLDADAKGVIDALVSDGRLAPASREAAESMYAEFGQKGLAAFAAGLPPKGAIVASSEPTPADPSGLDGDLTQDERDVIRATGKSESEIRALRASADKINSGARYVIPRAN